MSCVCPFFPPFFSIHSYVSIDKKEKEDKREIRGRNGRNQVRTRGRRKNAKKKPVGIIAQKKDKEEKGQSEKVKERRERPMEKGSEHFSSSVRSTNRL